MNIGEKNNRLIFLGLFLLMTLFYIWVAAQIPYCHDDWDWGLPIGIQQLLTANLNSRYVGNLVEVILTRSPVLKTIMMGMTFASLPAFTAVVALHASPEQRNMDQLIRTMLLGNILMVTLPIGIWQQTFGWVAGFSNFVVSTLFLVCYQYLLLNGERLRKDNWLHFLSMFLFGIAVQLLLENVTVYLMLLSTLVCIRLLKKGTRCHPVYALWLGNLLGTVTMFSSGMYRTLMSTGAALDGYRTLSFSRGDSFFSILVGFFRRFVILYPDRLWTQNTVLCCAVLLLLLLISIRKKNLPWLFLWCSADLAMLCYVLYYKAKGAVQLSSQWWSNVLSAGLGILLFTLVLVQCMMLFRENSPCRRVLCFLWISCPIIILPMIVISSVGPRSFLTSDWLLAEFVLILMIQLTEGIFDKRRKVLLTGTLLIAVALLWFRLGAVYADIGLTGRERAELIREARKGNTETIVLPSFPHGEYLWGSDPEYGSERVAFFRDFYHIPDGVHLWFERWGTFDGSSLAFGD